MIPDLRIIHYLPKGTPYSIQEISPSLFDLKYEGSVLKQGDWVTVVDYLRQDCHIRADVAPPEKYDAAETTEMNVEVLLHLPPLEEWDLFMQWMCAAGWEVDGYENTPAIAKGSMILYHEYVLRLVDDGAMVTGQGETLFDQVDHIGKRLEDDRWWG